MSRCSRLGNQGILFEDPATVKQDFRDFEQLSIPFGPANFLNRREGCATGAVFHSLKPTGFLHRSVDAQTADFASLMARGMTAARE